ncbi:MAG: hypothetical protein L3J28_10345 [Candidatus Polarisedimenticolaceae bacterium]|nr:hypothetical protein [Candidatus Polarisedimenticolaceae bacterium]
MKNLKEACKNHYQQHSLSKGEVAKLMALQERLEPSAAAGSNSEDPAANSSNRFPSAKNRNLLAVAASIIVIIYTTWIYNGYDVDIREQVAEEIAYNHSKQMALEIISDDLKAVGAYLSELDFTLIDSTRVGQIAQRLLGGRYCTIQGKLAAQLRIKSSNSTSTHTYYQAIIPENFNLDGTTYSTWIKGINIELWVEDGVLLGLAGVLP